MAKRKPQFDREIDGVRVRAYATRTDYEIIFNDDDIGDPEAQVICFPKSFGAVLAAQQGRLEYKA